MSDTHKGACFCGTVQIEVTGEPNVMGYCHTDVHRHAHDFEHVTDSNLQEKLREVTGSPDVDPHQRSIP